MSGAVCLTAVIPCRPEAVDVVEAASLTVGASTAAHEPGTLPYRVVRLDGDAPAFVTRERFRDRDAMRAHDEARASRAFFAATEGLLGGVTVLIGDEIQDDAEPLPVCAPCFQVSGLLRSERRSFAQAKAIKAAVALHRGAIGLEKSSIASGGRRR